MDLPVDLPFWLGIMRDHAQFIRDSLGPTEAAFIQQAEQMRLTFEQLLAGQPDPESVTAAVAQLVEFKRTLLHRLIECQLVIHLQPADLNQMINEAQEVLGVLGALPVIPPDPYARLLHLHLLWLSDAAGHSAMALANLDPNERLLIKEFRRFEKTFNGLFLLALEQNQIYDKIARPFRALIGLTNDARQTIEAHLLLVELLEALRARCEAEGTAPPRLPNHFIREERHYLESIALIRQEAPGF